MLNQQTQQINYIRSEFEKFKSQVEKINKFGYDVSQLDFLITQIQSIQHKLHQMSQNDLDPEIMGQIPQINHEMEQYKIKLEEKKLNFKGNNQLQQPNNDYKSYQVNQIEEIRQLKISNATMYEYIRKLEENQKEQDKKIQNLYGLFDDLLQQHNDQSLQVQQLNNELMQNKTQNEEKTLKINQLESQILQIQQKMNNNNLLALNQQQQMIQSLQNQIGNINHKLAQISQYQSIQPSQNFNS